VVDVRPEADETGRPDVLAPVLHPVGPKPARTYWLRRFLVLGVIIATVVLAVQLLARASDPDPGRTQTGAATTSSPEPSLTEFTTPSSRPSAQTATPTASAEATPAAAGTPQCAPADLAVTVATDASNYGADGDPTVSLTVTNKSAQACETNVGQNALEVKVASGDTAVWSSDVCYPGGESDVRTLEPGAVYTTSVVWRRVAAADGCPEEPRVDAGTYQVSGRAGDVVSEPVEIVLN
jgi:cytoskeletal protein RodZ